jgi:NAD(P)-dependent dehydrogenase (short-subunit alcohol dehydrogenase family)
VLMLPTLMSKKNRVAIVNLSSVAVLTEPRYSAVKGAILAFTGAVARDVASGEIRGNAFCPATSTRR